MLSLAQAAHDERMRKCGTCRGTRKSWRLDALLVEYEVPCNDCAGTGTIDGGTLDPFRLGVLADALEDAGCPTGGDACWRCCASGTRWTADAPGAVRPCECCRGTGRVPHPLLAHLRGPGPHVRGCWALDLLLNKE